MADKTKILVVDDDKEFCDSISDILEAKGYEVESENSGAATIAKIKEKNFDIAFIDIKMPVMNGIEVFKEIKKIRPKMTVIMMTAFSLENLISDALKEGTYGILYKPLDIEKVLKMIEAAKKEGGLGYGG